MHISQLKEKLLKLSLNGIRTQIITFDSDGDKEWNTGYICYRPEIEERFQIFDGDRLDLMFKLEAVISLEVMKEVWVTHCPSNVINYKEVE